MNKAVIETLEKAREVYGHKNQILVCMEELNELACVLAKYPRYADTDKATEELHSKVLDETADVTIILEHVKKIFGISEEELDDRINRKVGRLNRWLEHSESMQETIDDRKVDDSPCNTCVRLGADLAERNESYCSACLKAQATEGIAPMYIREGE